MQQSIYMLDLKTIVIYCQAILMILLFRKYYSIPVMVVTSKWIAPLERLVAFPTGVAGDF